MNKVYLLGGPPRTAKSVILKELLGRSSMPQIATDAVQEGLRNVFIDEPFQMLRTITIEGTAEYKDGIVGGTKARKISKQSTEAVLTLQAVEGMLDHYRRNKSDVVVEGSVITPQWATGLRTGGYDIRAAFTGYTDPAYADTILAFAKNDPND